MIVLMELQPTQEMYIDNHAQEDRRPFDKGSNTWSDPVFFHMPEMPGAQEELAKHIREIHGKLASTGAASEEGCHRANSIVRASFSNNAKHDMRAVWDACLAHVQKEW